ncbi:MAG: hypothetical protein H0U76_04825 [Ktedonobacteraceae bacterium]|nr:hypothetical protein [Ktedonobacteraceae bacterium]
MRTRHCHWPGYVSGVSSLIFFGIMSIATAVFSIIPLFSFIGDGLGFVSFICWIALMVAAARGRYYKLPVIGECVEGLEVGQQERQNHAKRNQLGK